MLGLYEDNKNGAPNKNRTYISALPLLRSTIEL